MDSTPSNASSGAIKIIAVSTVAIVVILVVVKQLDFTPSKVSTGTMSVEFQNKNGGVAPPPGEGAAPNVGALEQKVRELEVQLKARAEQAPAQEAPIATAPTTPAGSPQPQPQSVPPGPVTIAGIWRSAVYTVQFAQFGTGVSMQVYVNGVISAVGQGALSANTLQVDYVNNAYVPGRMTGTVSADGSRIDLVDYGRGYPQSMVLTR